MVPAAHTLLIERQWQQHPQHVPSTRQLRSGVDEYLSVVEETLANQRLFEVLQTSVVFGRRSRDIIRVFSEVDSPHFTTVRLILVDVGSAAGRATICLHAAYDR